MRPEVFIFLYGVGVILGVPSVVFWGLIARRRIRYVRQQWWLDRYAVLATAFSSISIGISIAYLVRVFVGLVYGFSTVIVHGIGGVALAVGLGFLMAGFLLMVLLADLETHPPKWRWTKLAMLGSLAWLVLVMWLSSLGWAPNL